MAAPDVSSLGEFEHMVLLAIMRLGEDAYAVPVRDEIVRCTRCGAASKARWARHERSPAAGPPAVRAVRAGRSPRADRRRPARGIPCAARETRRGPSRRMAVVAVAAAGADLQMGAGGAR